MIIGYIALFLISINMLTLFRFWFDKKQATKGGRRVPESDLLALALVGGTPAAYLGRHVFRHKTRKQPFSNNLFLIVVLQIAGLFGLLIFYS